MGLNSYLFSDRSLSFPVVCSFPFCCTVVFVVLNLAISVLDLGAKGFCKDEGIQMNLSLAGFKLGETSL